MLVRNVSLQDLIAKMINDAKYAWPTTNPPQRPQSTLITLAFNIAYQSILLWNMHLKMHTIVLFNQLSKTFQVSTESWIFFFFMWSRSYSLHTYTGIESMKHDMCSNLCIGFTGPFEDLNNCPVCAGSWWNQARLKATNGWVKVPVKMFTTIPLGPQLQSLYWDPNMAQKMNYLHIWTQQILDEIECTQQISQINNIAMDGDYLGGVLAGDIKENNFVLITSIDGAQLYENKDSNCWLYIWIVFNLPPDQCYRKIHVHPGGFIPGPR